MSAATPAYKTFRSEVTAIWEMDANQLEHWIRTSSQKLTPPELIDLVPLAGQERQQHEYVHNQLWKNIKTAVATLKMVPIPPKATPPEDEEDESNDSPQAKRLKTNNNNSKKKKPKVKPIRYQRVDPYQLWLHVPLPVRDDDDDDDNDDPEEVLGEDGDVIPATMGGRVSQLGVAGFVNSLALIENGFVHNKNAAEPKDEASKSKILLQFQLPNNVSSSTECKFNALQVHRLAVTWHRVIQAKVRQDILVTTPLRIQDMLASDLSSQEFASIRKRIYDTVVLGKGIHANEDNGDDTLATAKTSAGAVLEVEKFKKCGTCGNNDQSAFVLDRKNGDVICNNCGTVVSESLMHEGSQYRKFEGEADRNHHGDAQNPLYSNAHNMSTTLSGVQASSGAGIGGWRSGGGGRNLETILRNAHDYIELNVSQLGKTDRRTRVGYKDRQKKDAFIQMGHVGDALSLHEAVVQRAKELFAGFRDDRELVVQFKGVIAACLCEAFEQLSSAGLSIMKGDDASQSASSGSATGATAGNGAAPANPTPSDSAASSSTGYSARAARRNELHHAKLAGKGGLLLDFSDVATANGKNPASSTPSGGANSESPSAVSAVQNALEEAPAATWDLEHCRSWLLEASRRIAQQWVEDRNKGTAASKRIPSGTLEELEGKLVEHTFTLCEQLEEELQSRAKKSKSVGGGNGKRITTPRINEMGKLGIKWQHSHERGSGGKGGVGGSGLVANSMERTAGQSLILKTAKKLGSMLKDPVAGDAIHKELRAVVAKQEARKLKDRRQEASRQRLQQMKRKPYLLARAQQDKET